MALGRVADLPPFLFKEVSMYFDSETLNKMVQRKVSIQFLLADDAIGYRCKALLLVELDLVEDEIKDFAKSSAWALS